MVWKIGDAVWICLPNHCGERTLGEIVHEFELANWNLKHFVVEIRAGAVDWMLEVRDQYTMWREPAGGAREEDMEPNGLTIRSNLTPEQLSRFRVQLAERKAELEKAKLDREKRKPN